MGTITFKGNAVQTSGTLPSPGSQAPDFTLTNSQLVDVSLKDFAGKKVVLNIFPSIDTPVCQASVRAFNKKVAELSNVTLACVSRDLPFAQNRFCGAEGIEGIALLSDFRHAGFGKSYGLTMTDGPLNGLYSRAVIVLDESGKVLYSEQVPEIAQEPNYEAALAALA